jgi:hypothetical protein
VALLSLNEKVTSLLYLVCGGGEQERMVMVDGESIALNQRKKNRELGRSPVD